MASVKIDGITYDVLRKDCDKRPCFWPGQDKGTYTPGRGYTSYHTKPRWVCMTRHCHGCPMNSVCAKCRTTSVDPVGSACTWPGCDGVTIAMSKEATDG